MNNSKRFFKHSLLLQAFVILFSIPVTAQTFVSEFGGDPLGLRDDEFFQYEIALTTDASDNVYVADYSRREIQKYNSSGTFVKKWGGSYETAANQLDYVQDIAAGPSSSVYVLTIKDDFKILKFNSNGVLQSSTTLPNGTGSGQYEYPKRIFVASDGKIYILDQTSAKVSVLNADYSFNFSFGSSGSLVSQFDLVEDITVDASGNIYIADSNKEAILMFNSAGVYQKNLIFSLNSDDQAPAFLEMGTDGKVNVTYKSFGSLVSFDPATATVFQSSVPSSGVFAISSLGTYVVLNYEGSLVVYKNSVFQNKFGNLKAKSPGQFVKADLISTDAAGNLYVLEKNMSRINVLSSDGTPLRSFGSYTNADFLFSDAMDMKADADGNVYVSFVTDKKIRKYNSTGTLITSWGGAGTTNGLFTAAALLAIHDNKIYAFDNRYGTYKPRIQIFNNSGTYQTAYGEGQPNNVILNADITAFAIDADGNIYYNYFSASSIPPLTKVTANGSSKTSITSTYSFSKKLRLQVAGNKLIVGDATNQFVYLYDLTAGTFGTPLLGPGSALNRIAGISSITSDASANIYIGDTDNSRILKTDAAGTPLLSIAANETLGRISSFYAKFTKDSHNRFVVTSDGVIQRYTASGQYIDGWGTYQYSTYGAGFIVNAVAVQTDANDNVYVFDYGNMNIQKFDVHGNFVKSWGSSGTLTGQFKAGNNSHSDMLLDRANGYIYVADVGNHRIQKFDLNGTFITSWGSAGSNDGQFYEPQSIDQGVDGNFYIIDMSYVHVYTTAGTFVKKWDVTDYSKDKILVDEFGQVQLFKEQTVANNKYVTVFNTTQQSVKTWPSLSDVSAAQFSWVSDSYSDKNGYIYILSGNLIKKYTSQYVTPVLSTVNGTTQNAITLYPNPSTNGALQIKSEDAIEKITVIDVQGREETFTSSSFQTNLKGMLIIKIQTTQTVYTEKAIVF